MIQFLKSKFMPNSIIAAAFGLLLGFASINAHAIITLTPGDADATANIGDEIPVGNSIPPCDAECIAALFGLDPADVELVYKSNVGGGEEGPFANDYTTTYANTTTDPQDATITWDGPDHIVSSSIILEVKDGNQDPAYYFFDISGWDGMETIALNGFWPDQGAISHVSIWDGGGTTVPEPGILLLLGIGLLGLTTANRSKAG